MMIFLNARLVISGEFAKGNLSLKVGEKITKGIKLSDIKEISEIFTNDGAFVFGLQLKDEQTFISERYADEETAQMAQVAVMAQINALEIFSQRLINSVSAQPLPYTFVMPDVKTKELKYSQYSSENPVQTIIM